jgi:hypothetical protein
VSRCPVSQVFRGGTRPARSRNVACGAFRGRGMERLVRADDQPARSAGDENPSEPFDIG